MFACHFMPSEPQSSLFSVLSLLKGLEVKPMELSH